MADRFLLTDPTIRRSARPTIAALAALAALTAASAGVEAKNAPQETAPRDAGEPIMAIVSIKSQLVTFYDSEGWIVKAPVSTGVRGRETPAGVFAVLQKNKDHRSNLYDDAWMPHMQRLTWNGIALHGGPLPGYAASHGCIRLPYSFAKKMFDETRIGMRVIISPRDATPVEISHAALLVPDPQAVAAAPERARTLAEEADAAAKAVGETKALAKKTAREAASAKSTLRKLERRKSYADDQLASAVKRLERAKGDKAIASAEERKLKAETKAAEAGAKLEAAKDDAETKIEAAAAAEEAAKQAVTRKDETEKAAKEAQLAAQPVSIYISRATKKLYVRRNTKKPWPDGGEVFDSSIEVPVEIRDPDKPIGTHVFTAMAANDSGLRWSAVSIDEGDTAEEALDRITIPAEVLEQIAPTALPRSSIVISDEPLSRETNYRTEFVAVLSNQPQGGFKTRRPAVSTAEPQQQPGGLFGFFGQSNQNQRRERRRRHPKWGWR